jgi:hypothetical protein
MEKVIKIDGNDVMFKATAATLRIYRMKFRRDLMLDLSRMAEKINKKKSEIEISDLEIFENVAYIMAKQADSTIPETPEEWLDGFNTFAIRDILPGIMELWRENMQTVGESKKKMKAIAEK